MKTILLLEDDENLNRGISLRLEKEGYRVLPAFHISQARRLFHENEVSLIIVTSLFRTAADWILAVR
ncbi:MAG: hypothetical protein ACLVAW_04600 [Eisenbergiella massiliensis]